MEYRFYDRGDDELIATSELACDDGIALAVRTTGYDPEESEVIELAIANLSGQTLFSQRVKPQNVDEWAASEASGGLVPADVAEAPELFQFEDEIIELFEKAKVVVCQHLAFTENAIESSWVSLPKFEGTDVIELFCQSHCTTDYPNEPAATAALPGIAQYYGLGAIDDSASGEAALIAHCYRAIVREHAEQREAKGEAYWARYDESKAGERAQAAAIEATKRKREHRLNQMNALLWIAGGLIFTSLAIQLYQRGGDIGVIIIAGAIAAFAYIRGIVNFRK